METGEFPTLFGRTSKGEIKQWDVLVFENEYQVPVVRTVHGLKDGKKQVNDKKVIKGKNIGKSNETTPFEQAVFNADSKWRKQIDNGYTEDVPDENSYVAIRPQRADPFSKRKHNIKGPIRMEHFTIKHIPCYHNRVEI